MRRQNKIFSVTAIFIICLVLALIGANAVGFDIKLPDLSSNKTVSRDIFEHESNQMLGNPNPNNNNSGKDENNEKDKNETGGASGYSASFTSEISIDENFLYKVSSII